MRPLALALPCLAAAACASPPELDPHYRPSASALEIVAVLQRHVPDDTYRFEPARDFTDRNVYRSSLLRLENLEALYPDALRAGHLDAAIAFAKARALERLRAYDLAAEAYGLAAEREAELAAKAQPAAAFCDELAEGIAVPGPLAPADPVDGVLAVPDPETVLADFETRLGRLEALALRAPEPHHVFILQEEIEHLDLERARYFVRLRDVVPEGDLRAVGELQRVALRHGASKHAARHQLALADLYVDLSVEYVASHPPEGLHFDPAHFRDLVDSGARLYEIVSARDGRPEKIEASRRLEAFLAFAVSVDRDRFAP